MNIVRILSAVLPSATTGIPTEYRLTGIPPNIHQASLRPDWVHGIGVETQRFFTHALATFGMWDFRQAKFFLHMPRPLLECGIFGRPNF